MCEWVSVKDKLPDETEFVMVWDKDGVDFGRYYEDQGWLGYGEHLTKVTHWMPIPAPPTQKEELKDGS